MSPGKPRPIVDRDGNPVPPETMTYEQFISDTIEVTNYLRSRFGKEKIYLNAHSGGSLFALQVAARRPDLYYAYIGMGQMLYGLRSEQLAQEYMLGNRIDGAAHACPGVTAAGCRPALTWRNLSLRASLILGPGVFILPSKALSLGHAPVRQPPR